MRRLIGVAVALSLAAAVVGGDAAGTPARDALVRPGAGIGQVELRMSLAQVRRVLGPPSAVNRRERYGFGSQYVEYAWSSAGWTVGLVGRPGSLRVVKVATTLRRERTRGGLGVGSPLAALERTRGARCGAAFNRGSYVGHWCLLGKNGVPQVGFGLDDRCAVTVPRYVACPRYAPHTFEVVVAEAAIFRQQLRIPQPG
ncbi:MAG: hypothetical protein H0T39_15260 [Actinobacteria bacterium]|nr:hypothetical protein [Actinomycetota bacterium]